ncbi:hypothetical protein [Neobacillus soli]|uniref:hypothetical protein n=1 Tax=Neobacillus soli TaxID=220688 RepID=UPI000825DEBF|nr:hypothetical protein [Neobacillus soli]
MGVIRGGPQAKDCIVAGKYKHIDWGKPSADWESHPPIGGSHPPIGRSHPPIDGLPIMILTAAAFPEP